TASRSRLRSYCGLLGSPTRRSSYLPSQVSALPDTCAAGFGPESVVEIEVEIDIVIGDLLHQPGEIDLTTESVLPETEPASRSVLIELQTGSRGGLEASCASDGDELSAQILGSAGKDSPANLQQPIVDCDAVVANMGIGLVLSVNFNDQMTALGDERVVEMVSCPSIAEL